MAAATGAAKGDDRAYTTPVAIMAAGLLLPWPAFHNGYPLVTVDTAAYLEAFDSGAVAWDAAIFYAAFIRALGWHSLWPIAIVQGLIAAHLIHLTLKVCCGTVRPEIYLWTIACVAAFSSLPWFASLILPDVMAGIMVLGLFLLGTVPERLGRAERWYVAALTALAAAADATPLVLGIGLAGLIAATRLILGRRLPLRFSALAWLAGPIVLAALGHVAANAAAGRGPAIAPTAPYSMLAAMIRDGTAQAYLALHCPERRFQLCDRLAELRREPENFTADPARLVPRGDDGQVWRDEARAIVGGVLRTYPAWQAGKVAEHTAHQLFAFDTDDWLVLRRPAEQWTGRTIRDRFPAEYSLYLGARQGTARLSAAAIGVWHGFGAIVGVTLSVFLFIEFARRGDHTMTVLFAIIALALIGNALITGGLSEVQGRNQSRIVWLAILYAAIATQHFRLCTAAETTDRNLLSPR